MANSEYETRETQLKIHGQFLIRSTILQLCIVVHITYQWFIQLESTGQCLQLPPKGRGDGSSSIPDLI